MVKVTCEVCGEDVNENQTGANQNRYTLLRSTVPNQTFYTCDIMLTDNIPVRKDRYEFCSATCLRKLICK
jgi:hypothetical protein